MKIHQQVKTQLQKAMKERDTKRVEVIRNILSTLTNELISQGKKPQDILDDADVLKVIKRLAKQRQDSIEQYTQGNRPELAAEEQGELAVLQTYLPAQMEKSQIEPIAKAKQDELGIVDPSQKGRLIGALMQELGDQADGNTVRQVVDELIES